MVLTSRFDDAFCYAHELHREQRRKGSAIPYVSHLMAVSALVIEHGGNEDQAIGALLHDAVEDAGDKKILERIDADGKKILERVDVDGEELLEQVRERFGNVVAEIVADCTDAWTTPKPDWRPRKEAYLERLRAKEQGSPSLLVSLADKTHNAEAIASDYRCIGDRLWERFNRGKDDQHWYYAALVGIYSQKLPGPLLDRLGQAVRNFA